MSKGIELETSGEVTSVTARNKRRILLRMVILFAVCGFATGLSHGDTLHRVVDFGMAIAFAILVLDWCAQDRAERNLRPWRGFTLMMVFFPTALVMVPLYLIKTRGLGGVKSTILAAAFFIAILLVALIAAEFAGALFGES